MMLAWGFILLGSLACLGVAHPIQTDMEPQWILQEITSDGVYTYERQKRLVSPAEDPGAPEVSEHDIEEPRSAEGPFSHEEVPDAVYGSKGALEPRRKPKAPKRRPVEDEDEDDDEDDDDSVARKGGRPGGSVYRNFFPMSFGAKYRRARNTDGDGGDVRSIANSFSTGRGAVASSSAKAYGSPNTRENRRAELRI